MSNSTISISFKVQDAGDFKKLVVNAEDFKKAIRSTVEEAEGLRKTSINFAALSTSIDSASRTLSDLHNICKDLTGAYALQAQVETQLATVMQQRMEATDADIQAVKDLASAQQQLGVIGDEVQLAGVQQVATFLSQKRSIETLLPAMNNLLAQQRGLNATSQDAISIGNLLGKAMQGQTSALRRVGITFNEAQERVMKFGTESERAAKLAEIITQNVGEMNAALAKTDAGKQKQLENSLGDIKERLGALIQRIMPTITGLNTIALASLNATKVFQGLKAVTVTVANGLGAMQLSSRILTASFASLTVGSKALTVATWGLNAALGAGILGAVIAIIALFNKWSDSADRAAEATKRAAREATDFGDRDQHAPNEKGENESYIDYLERLEDKRQTNLAKLRSLKATLINKKDITKAEKDAILTEAERIKEENKELRKSIKKAKEEQAEGVVITGVKSKNPKTATKTEIPEGSLKQLNSQISDIHAKIELAIDNESRAALYAELHNLETEKHFIEFRYKYPEAPVRPDFKKPAVIAPKIETDIKKLNPELEPVTEKLASMRKEAEESISAFDAFRGTYAGLKGIGSGIEGITEALEGNGNAWQKITAIIDGFLQIYDGIAAIVEIINMMSAPTTAATAVTAAHTAVTEEDTTASLTNTTAKSGEAVASATASGAKIPFPANLIAIAAGVAAVVGALALIRSFASGGIVGGSSPSGDRLLARVNSGEMILNNRQQKRLFDMLNAPYVARGVSVPEPQPVNISLSPATVATLRDTNELGGVVEVRIKERELYGILKKGKDLRNRS